MCEHRRRDVLPLKRSLSFGSSRPLSQGEREEVCPTSRKCVLWHVARRDENMTILVAGRCVVQLMDKEGQRKQQRKVHNRGNAGYP